MSLLSPVRFAVLKATHTLIALMCEHRVRLTQPSALPLRILTHLSALEAVQVSAASPPAWDRVVSGPKADVPPPFSGICGYCLNMVSGNGQLVQNPAADLMQADL